MNPLQEFDNLLRAKLEGIPFPVDKLGKIPMVYLSEMFKISSIADFKCDLEVYKNMIGDSEKWNYYSASFIINRFFELSPNDLGLEIPEYHKLLVEVSNASQEWNKVVAPIQKKLQVDFQNRQSLKVVKPNGNIVNPNLRKR